MIYGRSFMAKGKQKLKLCRNCDHGTNGFRGRVLVTRCHLAGRNVSEDMAACGYWRKKGRSGG